MDGVTKEAYGQDLEQDLQDLHARMKAKRYRHQPIRRVQIPKDGGKTRPIGISAFEDKRVQDAVREVLEAIYEQDFLDCSYGFRPARSAHDAVRTLDRVVHQGKVNWILEADIVCRRLRHRLRVPGRCAARDGRSRPATGAFRTDPASRPDATVLLSATAEGIQERQGSGDLRLPRVHALLGADPQGTLGDVLQDTQCESETDDPVRLRLVSSPSTPAGGGPARGAQEAHPGPLQLLRGRGERQLPKFAARPRTGEAVLVQVALPSEPTQASHLGAVRGLAPRFPAPAASDHGPDLGPLTTSRLHGGAGWWKSPCPDLERALSAAGRGREPPGPHRVGDDIRARDVHEPRRGRGRCLLTEAVRRGSTFFGTAWSSFGDSRPSSSAPTREASRSANG